MHLHAESRTRFMVKGHSSVPEGKQALASGWRQQQGAHVSHRVVVVHVLQLAAHAAARFHWHMDCSV